MKQKQLLAKQVLAKQALAKQLKIVKGIAEDAAKDQEYKIAQDPDTLGAINVVEEFLRTKKRICYGGQAINAHLPNKYKFYKETDLPDYDFFTPTPDQDIDELVEAFTAKGFREIGIRLSVHEGTTKLYINFMPMADITGVDDQIFKKLLARAMPYDGIYYADPDFLRMMMYLELSRPAGEVDRWDKVYERLFLLNTFQPIKACKWKSDKRPALSDAVKEGLLGLLVDREMVIAGLDVYSAFKSRKRHNIRWFVRSWPLIAYSADPAADIDMFVEYMNKMLGENAVKVDLVNSVGEIVPPCAILRYQEVPVLLLVKETACHSYVNMKMIGSTSIKVASIDTLITLFMSFMFHPDLDEIIARPILCLIHEMILYSMKVRAAWDSKENATPFLSITCSGHQKQITTLLRERAERIGRLRNTKKKVISIKE